ncbi:MAG: C40 family peptidase [Bacteroidales bacterium]|nr:C40 family peptidase [Bacteroidales bacterium]
MIKKIVLAICLGIAAAFAAGAQNHAVVNVSTAHLRSAADYESGLETEALMGDVVDILETNGIWALVSTDQPYKAWVNEMALARMDDDALADYHKSRKYICTAVYSTVYDAPSLKAQPIGDLVMGDVLRMGLSKDKPVVKKKFAEVVLPSGLVGYVPKGDLMDHSKWKDSSNPSPEAVIALARRFLGVPYLWGGMSPKGFDCSGLVRFCYMMNGILLPRNASAQALLGEEIPLTEVLPGEDASARYAALKPGDLLFFGKPAKFLQKERITHVAIYIGGGRIIQSSQIVRINSLIEGEPDFYETENVLLKARRIL